MKLLKHGLLAIGLLTLPVINAVAAPIQTGRWTVSYYYTTISQKADPAHIAGKLYKRSNACFQADGTWYLADPIDSNHPVTFQGHWESLGTLVYLHLNGGEETVYGGENQGGILTTPNPTLLTGYWQSWGDKANTYNDYFTTKWDFSKKTCDSLPQVTN